MKELIGYCSCCGKEVFCLDGFFNAIYTDDKKIVCFDCHDKKREAPVKRRMDWSTSTEIR